MKKILITFLIVLSTNLFAQQDPLFSQYIFNKSAINPACAGSHDYLKINVLYRYQWVNVNGAPKTLYASAYSILRNPHVGIGLNIYNDIIGPSITQGALATFAYQVLFPESRLSFGLQAGYKYTDIFWSKVKTFNAGDPIVNAQFENRVVPDANFGVYYYTKKFYLGLSSKELLQNEMNIVRVNGRNQYTKLLRHLYTMVGASFILNNQLRFQPSMLIKFVKNSPPQLDINASFFIMSSLLVGCSYRTEKAVALMTEFNVTEFLRLGYSYDLWFNALQFYNRGSHEIHLGFDLDIFNRRMLTPRYF
ncbi:MAG: type IX secretion system membrane protein PorP/SprF [Bacteroidales bacterium]|nr:type IX secretion system membrane protein PorP/SprF [Bacteroidales bacterium]